MHIGVDLGSRALKLAVFDDNGLAHTAMVESGFNPHRQAEKMIREFASRRVVATGYGRHLAHHLFADGVITEIKAHALGARHFFPEARTILDVGGQDCKVIRLDQAGRVVNFQMNDKCAAGTGRFLEIMATTLGFSLEDFGQRALMSRHEAPINSMCTVFAESEVISLKNHGTPPQDIARALHLAVVNRLCAMIRNADDDRRLVFTGGVANNPAIVSLLQEKLDVEVVTPEQPELTGAVGAALHARSMWGGRSRQESDPPSPLWRRG